MYWFSPGKYKKETYIPHHVFNTLFFYFYIWKNENNKIEYKVKNTFYSIPILYLTKKKQMHTKLKTFYLISVLYLKKKQQVDNLENNKSLFTFSS